MASCLTTFCRVESVGCLLLVAFLAIADAADPLLMDSGNPARVGHFSGQVFDPNDKPLAGAEIYVVPISKDLSGRMVAAEEIATATVRTTTDVEGRFDIHAPDVTITDLDGVPTNRLCLVIATAKGFGPDWAQIHGRTRSSPMHDFSTNIKLQLVADDVPIAGRILGPDGRPLAGARVQATTIMIPKDGDLSAHLDREIKKTLHSGFLSGTSPFERSLYYWAQMFPTAADLRTDSDGKFTLTGIGRDRLVQLKVTAPTIVDTTLTTMTRDVPDVATRTGGKEQLGAEFREHFLVHGARFTRQFKPGRTISGVVLDAATGEPIPGMLVGLGHKGKPRGGIGSHQTVADNQGKFKITGIDPWNDEWSVTAVSPPGMTYLPASTMGQGNASVEVRCPPAIPYRLKVVDEQGHPVLAEVTAFDVTPNPHAPQAHVYPCYTPLSIATRLDDGTYRGFVAPGPGVVLVKTPEIHDYLPAFVDPKTFFAPDRKAWTSQEKITSYGTHDTVAITGGLTNQSDYAAIVLVNPAHDSPPLELTATVRRATPRQVTLVDPQGQPISGVKTNGLTDHGRELPLRTATFPLVRLHPERVKRIIFAHEERKLTAYLVARGDGDTPYTVTLQPWATIKGRFVDATGAPLPLGQKDTEWEQPLHVKASLPEDPDYRHAQYADVKATGQFTLDKLIPGQLYDGMVYQNQGKLSLPAFTGLELAPGETRDLGDIRLDIYALAEARFQDSKAIALQFIESAATRSGPVLFKDAWISPASLP